MPSHLLAPLVLPESAQQGEAVLHVGQESQLANQSSKALGILQ